MIFDTHTHYDDDWFDEDRDALLRSLPEKGVANVVNVGASMRGARATYELMKKYDHIYGAIGVHPDEVGELERAETENTDMDSAAVCSADMGNAAVRSADMDSAGTVSADMGNAAVRDAAVCSAGTGSAVDNGNACMRELRAMLAHEKAVAVGEIGLDYHWNVESREVQKKWFVRQMELALACELPIVVHSREASQDSFDCIKAHHAGKPGFRGGIIHCYSGSVEMAREYIKMGYYIGIGGVITYKNARVLKEVAAEVPLSRIVLETDCPYLTPVPHRKERNCSLYLPYVIEEIARVRNVSCEEIERATYENARRVYQIADGR